jgi:hypothetical protein
VAALALGTRNPNATKAKPKAADAELKMSFANRDLPCSTVRCAFVFVFISNVSV